MIVSTTTGGDTNCRANNYNYRLDTVGAREFLGRFLNLPWADRQGGREMTRARATGRTDVVGL
jgi:hypothetical protein